MPRPKREASRSDLLPEELRAAPKKPPKRKIPPPKPIEVQLTRQHRINGLSYGPGPALVPAEIANILRDQERRAQWEETELFNKRAYFVAPGNRKVEIAPERLDSGAIPEFAATDRSLR